MTRYRYVTGDGRKFATFEQACTHASHIHRLKGIFISVEEIK